MIPLIRPVTYYLSRASIVILGWSLQQTQSVPPPSGEFETNGLNC